MTELVENLDNLGSYCVITVRIIITIFTAKTRSVDQILEQKRVQSRSQFHSVDNMSQVSSISTGPRPDISGESGSVEMFQ